MSDSKRTRLLRLRRRIRIRRRMFAVGRDGLAIIYVCSECGTRSTTVYSNPFEADLFERYHSRENGGCEGVCPKCTKKRRDERFPLNGTKR